jgi:T4 RnlA family RNA ligase
MFILFNLTNKQQLFTVVSKRMNYEKGKELVKYVDGFCEIKKIEDNVSIFSYRYSKYENFMTNEWAKWMRGITFVFTDSNNYEMYPMLPKFFNVDENEDNQLTDLKKLKIKNVTEKRDGSLVMPIILNNTIRFKTMKSIKNEITSKCQLFYKDDSNYKSFIDDHINKYSILFEYTSPYNKIVLEYSKEELRLISMVDRNTFEIMDYDKVKGIANNYNIPLVASIEVDNIDDLLEMKSKRYNIEGWVITFENNKIVKLKTTWYASLHSGFSFINISKVRLHLTVKNILDNTIDDVIPLIEDEERKLYIINLKDKIEKHYEHLVSIIEKQYIDYGNYKNIKEYIVHIRSLDKDDDRKKYLSILLESIKNGKYRKNIKLYLLKKMNRNDKAKMYIESIL